jgi:hypothetical protein
MPKPENVKRLDLQFSMVEALTREVLDCHVVELTQLERERFDVDGDELGGGTGYFAIQCATEGAKQVIVLAPNRATHACVRYNVAVAHQDSVVESRLVAPGADSVLAAIKPKEPFDYVVVNTETTLDDAVILMAIEQLPNWLRGGGKGWVICEKESTVALVTARCQSLGFNVEMMQHSDPTRAVAPLAYPQTLQIDPFTPAAKAAATNSESANSESVGTAN